MVHVEGVKRTRDMPKLIWVKIVKRDISACDLTIDTTLDRMEWLNRPQVVGTRPCCCYYLKNCNDCFKFHPKLIFLNKCYIPKI